MVANRSLLATTVILAAFMLAEGFTISVLDGRWFWPTLLCIGGALILALEVPPLLKEKPSFMPILIIDPVLFILIGIKACRTANSARTAGPSDDHQALTAYAVLEFIQAIAALVGFGLALFKQQTAKRQGNVLLKDEPDAQAA